MLQDSDSNGDFDTITNVFGDTLTVTGATRQFTVAVTKVPVDVCSRIVPFDAGGNGLIGIASVSDGTATDSDGLAAAEAATICAKNATGSEVTLTWTFDR